MGAAPACIARCIAAHMPRSEMQGACPALHAMPAISKLCCMPCRSTSLCALCWRAPEMQAIGAGLGCSSLSSRHKAVSCASTPPQTQCTEGRGAPQGYARSAALHARWRAAQKGGVQQEGAAAHLPWP